MVEPSAASSALFPHLYAVILAGGSGSRLWPLSREEAPKQMLTMFGENSESLLSQTVKRAARVSSDITILTSEILFDEIRNRLLSESEDHKTITLLAEPLQKNTAFAIALAAAYIAGHDPDGVLLVLPSDHLVSGDAQWDQGIQTAYETALLGKILTFGIVPTRAETGYGYILPESSDEGHATKALPVKRFIEKPSEVAAEEFLQAGNYLWNAGIFMARASMLLDEYNRVGEPAADIAAVAKEIAASGHLADAHARELAEGLPSISIDKALLEKSANVYVVPTEIEWDDVGSLESLALLGQQDPEGNILIGNTVDVDSHDLTTYASDHLVATLGLSDLIVASTADATLIAAKDRVQDVRKVVQKLKEEKAAEVVRSKKSMRPWGSWTLISHTPLFNVKQIEVNPGKRLSLQSHKNRSEHWVVVEGQAIVEFGRAADALESITLDAGQSTYLSAGTLHRLGNATQETLIVVEVATGSYLGEDDITRYKDDWSR